MSTFAELAEANPNIRAQYDEWRELRAQRGEDPLDWGAFRGHAMAIGAPDPGSRPPDDFVGEDYKAAHPEWTQRWYGTTAAAPGGFLDSQPAGTAQAVQESSRTFDRTSVTAGMEVIGSDGQRIGTVKEVADTEFSVNRRMQRDIDVPYSAVRELDGNRVTLNVPASQADRV